MAGWTTERANRGAADRSHFTQHDAWRVNGALSALLCLWWDPGHSLAVAAQHAQDHIRITFRTFQENHLFFLVYQKKLKQTIGACTRKSRAASLIRRKI